MAALKSSVLQNDFLCYKQNTFERNLTVGNPQQPCCTQHFQGPRNILPLFLPEHRTHQIKGLPFFHCSSISAASKENLCREKRDWHFFYNKANCLSLPHSIKCLLLHFTTQQEVEGQRGPTAEQRTCHLTIHLRPRFQWETTAFLPPSSSSKQPQGSTSNSSTLVSWS